MNRPKLGVRIKVYHSCLISPPDDFSDMGSRLLVPYLIDELKQQLKYNILDAVLNRVYYNIRMGRIGKKVYGVMSVSTNELVDIGIYIEDRKKGEKR